MLIIDLYDIFFSSLCWLYFSQVLYSCFFTLLHYIRIFLKCLTFLTVNLHLKVRCLLGLEVDIFRLGLWLGASFLLIWEGQGELLGVGSRRTLEASLPITFSFPSLLLSRRNLSSSAWKVKQVTILLTWILPLHILLLLNIKKYGCLFNPIMYCVNSRLHPNSFNVSGRTEFLVKKCIWED